MFRSLVERNRSYRRFKQEPRVDRAMLEGLVEVARICPSAMNLQPLKFLLSADKKRNAIIFPHLMWAGYLADWNGPSESERPTAYIVILGDTEIRQSFGCDHGIVAQTMLLEATALGFGGCMIGAIQREGLQDSLNIPRRFEILLTLALGTPDEEVILESIEEGGRIEYWRDAAGRHHVPKRTSAELIVG